ncbi:MAG: hypothetical protein J7K98_03970 [Candidatus Aenigmarchaeota archaeon]|nr:hypothetical protein [Candidatus Aenigmarchaeota archaeon]
MRKLSKGQAIDEFAFVLLAGLIFIIIALVTWGVGPSGGGESVNQTENLTLTGDVELVGLQEVDVPKTYWIGKFAVKYGVGTENVVEKANLIAEKSLFGEKPLRITFSIDKLKLENYVTSGFLVLDIGDSSMDSDLLVYLNGKLIKRVKPTIGEVSFQIPKENLKTSNVLEIKVSFPGFKFWSKGFYEFDKIIVGLNIYGMEEKISTFDVSEEQIENFKTAKLEFEVEDYDARGNLVIRLNGNTIYSGVPEKFFGKEFSLEDLGLVKGSNTITFSTTRGGFYELDDVRLTIVHSRRGIKSLEKSFEISSDAYTRLKAGKKGTIKFYVKDILHPGILRIKIKDTEGNVNEVIFQQFSEGMNEVKFSIDDVKEGTNWVIFESPDGAFYIGGIQVIV